MESTHTRTTRIARQLLAQQRNMAQLLANKDIEGRMLGDICRVTS